MRLFIASTFPDDVLREVNEHVARVKTRLPPSSWVRAESQHLTYAFLGEQEESLVAELEPLLCARLSKTPAFETQIHGCGFFPNSRRARVAWLGVTVPEKFEAVAVAIRGAVQVAGVKLDGSEFKPHLTLCRLRDPWPPACIDIFNHSFGKVESRPFRVDRVILYSSQLNPKGAIHTPLREFRLA